MIEKLKTGGLIALVTVLGVITLGTIYFFGVPMFVYDFGQGPPIEDAPYLVREGRFGRWYVSGYSEEAGILYIEGWYSMGWDGTPGALCDLWRGDRWYLEGEKAVCGSWRVIERGK